jgi:hypothetical protein
MDRQFEQTVMVGGLGATGGYFFLQRNRGDEH